MITIQKKAPYNMRLAEKRVDPASSVDLWEHQAGCPKDSTWSVLKIEIYSRDNDAVW